MYEKCPAITQEHVYLFSTPTYYGCLALLYTRGKKAGVNKNRIITFSGRASKCFWRQNMHYIHIHNLYFLAKPLLRLKVLNTYFIIDVPMSEKEKLHVVCPLLCFRISVDVIHMALSHSWQWYSLAFGFELPCCRPALTFSSSSFFLLSDSSSSTQPA